MKPEPRKRFKQCLNVGEANTQILKHRARLGGIKQRHTALTCGEENGAQHKNDPIFIILYRTTPIPVSRARKIPHDLGHVKHSHSKMGGCRFAMWLDISRIRLMVE